MGEASVYLSRTAGRSNMAARGGRHFALAAGLPACVHLFSLLFLISYDRECYQSLHCYACDNI